MGQTKLKESQVAAALNNQTGTDYTLGLVDSNRTVRISNAAPNTVTVPANASVAIRIGSIITILQWGAGQTTLVEDDGVTINTPNGLVLAGQGAAVDIIKVAADEWDLVVTASAAGSGGVVSVRKDINSLVYDGVSAFMPAPPAPIELSYFEFGDGGAKGYVADTNNDKVGQVDFTVPYDLTTLSDPSKSISTGLSNFNRFVMHPLGTSLIITDETATIRQIALTTPWDITTTSSTATFAVGDGVDAFRFVDSGSKFIVLVAGPRFHVYSMSVPYDITTASLLSSSSLIEAYPVDFIVADSGKQLITIRESNATMSSVTLSTPYDVSTCSLDSGSVSLSPATTAIGISFSGDETKILVSNRTNDRVYQFSIANAV